MMADRNACIALVIVILSALDLGCGKPTVSEMSSANSNPQKLPFDRQPKLDGISPTHSFVPTTSALQEGTPFNVRLLATISSATARSGDVFTAALDEDIVTSSGETAIEQGTRVTGSIQAAKLPSGRDPGYLRISLASIDFDGRQVPIETSSIFASGSHDKRPSPLTTKKKDVSFDVNRRLTFRLAKTVELR